MTDENEDLWAGVNAELESLSVEEAARAKRELFEWLDLHNAAQLESEMFDLQIAPGRRLPLADQCESEARRREALADITAVVWWAFAASVRRRGL